MLRFNLKTETHANQNRIKNIFKFGQDQQTQIFTFTF